MFRRILLFIAVIAAGIGGVVAFDVGWSRSTSYNLFAGVPFERGDARARISDRPPVGGPSLIRHPRFIVELIRVGPVEESGLFDWTGSDEIYVVYHSLLNNVVTYEHEQIDTGDTIEVPSEQRCVWPAIATGGGVWTCAPSGGAAPVIFVLSVWEADWPGPWDTGFCVALRGVQPPGPYSGECDDDDFLLQTGTLVFDEAALLERLPVPNTSFEFETESWAAHAGDFHYPLTVRVSRVADHIEDRPSEASRQP